MPLVTIDVLQGVWASAQGQWAVGGQQLPAEMIRSIGGNFHAV